MRQDLRFDNPLLRDEKWVQHHTAQLIARFPKKVGWFLEHEYNPHAFQLHFHCATDDSERLSRWRSLVAGRRGGKTLCAAWEMAYYITHPEEWWMDAHGEENQEDGWWWFLAADHKVGLAGLITFRQVLKKAGLLPNKDYKENRQEKFFEFDRGRIDFRSADNPASLVGAGLNGIWLDEAAKIPTDDAWTIVRPCLSDKMGCGIFTTTPEGRNWLFKELHSDETLDNPDITRIEYRSLDSPFFKKEEWELLLETYHPLAFQREFMASFSAFAGRDLPGEWLEPFYTWDDLPRKEGKTGNSPDCFDLDYYIGVDPAISIADNADFFALSVIGVPKGSANRAYVIESLNLHISFAEQLDKINEYERIYRPMYIGIEDVAYQRALVQQATRLDSAPNVIGVPAKGTKVERIMSMSPAFRVGKCRVQGTNKRFLDEWLNYDVNNKNAEDDVLDSVEIALRIAGVVSEEPMSYANDMKATVKSPDDWIRKDLPKKFDPETDNFEEYESEDYSWILDTSDHDGWMDM